MVSLESSISSPFWPQMSDHPPTLAIALLHYVNFEYPSAPLLPYYNLRFYQRPTLPIVMNLWVPTHFAFRSLLP
jgi:hypothetical protein